jgi:protein O-GlcNAc transferase
MSQVLAKVLQAERLLAANQVEQAATILLPVAQKNPKDPNAASLASIILFRQRKYVQALHYAKIAAALIPTDSNYHANLGLLLAANNKHTEAKAAYQRALVLNPKNIDATLSLANTALNENNPTLAAQLCRSVLESRWDTQICPTYVAALSAMGKVKEAAEFAKAAIAQFPNDTLLMSGRASNLNYVWGASPAEIADAHRQFGDAILQHRPPVTFKHTSLNTGPDAGTPVPERPLRIGLVSCDLRAHSVSFFIEPLLRYTPAESARFYAYSTTRHEDNVSQRLKPLCEKWHNCGDLIDLEICRIIEADSIDILIDLGGLTLNNSTTIFAYKPAPIQATYCGYPNTTGLTSIDYRIVDARTDPLPDSPQARAARDAGQPDYDQRCSEKLLRLDPCFLCYSPPPGTPDPHRDHVKYPALTFGSFNGNKKIVDELLDLWARLLLSVPASRLLLKTFEFKDEYPRTRILTSLQSRGVDPSWIDIHGPTSGLAEHLAFYERMDISLDTVPYNGTTTTCESLWMGVPVITLAGTTHASRVGVSLLSTIGAPELIAPDADSYVTLAAQLANDPARLAQYRTTLRTLMSNSPLCNGPAFAKTFITALRGTGFQPVKA